MNDGVIKAAGINMGDLRYDVVVSRAAVGGCGVVAVVVVVVDAVADNGSSRASRRDADDAKGVAIADADTKGVVVPIIDDVAGSH